MEKHEVEGVLNDAAVKGLLTLEHIMVAGNYFMIPRNLTSSYEQLQ